jgi:hypothetical protein
MKFTLDAGGAQAAGQGIGNMFKALALGQQYRDKAEQDALFNNARMAQAAASARKSNADAQIAETRLGFASNPMETAMLELGLPTGQADDFRTRLETGKWGGQYAPPGDGMGPTMPEPVDDDTVAKLGQTISLLHRMYGTESNVQQGAAAALTDQQRRNIDRVIAGHSMAENVGRAYAAAEGKALFENVGNTGYSLDKFGGGQSEANPVLAKLFGQVQQSMANENNAQAANAGASAKLTNQKLNVLNTVGALPGTGSDGAEGALSSTILGTLKVPALDEKGRPVRNPITGEQEMTVDLDAQRAFYSWADTNKRKPTATAFAQWEAQGRPGANKNPAPAANPPKIEAAPPANQRKPNTVYQTPKGPMKWTGTGWLPAN